MLVPSSIYGIPNAKINDSRYCTYFFWHHAASKVDIFTACVRYCTRRPDASTMTLPVLCFCLLCVDLFRLAGQKVLLQQGPERQKKVFGHRCQAVQVDRDRHAPPQNRKVFFRFQRNSKEVQCNICYIKTSRTFIHSNLFWSHSTVELQCYFFKWRKKAANTLKSELELISWICLFAASRQYDATSLASCNKVKGSSHCSEMYKKASHTMRRLWNVSPTVPVEKNV